jgi:hypothetical protein
MLRPSSGDLLVRLRGSIWWMGACAVMSGVIVSPAGISGPAPGRSFVRSFVRLLVLVVVVVVVVDATICIADMVRRYAPPICTTDMQGLKTEKAKSNMLLAPDGLLL